MADNTQLNTGTGGDVIRDIDRGAGAKTQVVQLDIGGSAVNAENLATGYIPVAKLVDSGTAKPIFLSEESGAVLTEDGSVVQELQEIKTLLFKIAFMLAIVTDNDLDDLPEGE